VAGKRVGGFSLGMGQRLGIAAALLGDPQTLILDEPVNGLDPEGVRWVRQLVRDLAGEGRTVFLSSHLMTVGAAFGCSRAQLHDGHHVRDVRGEVALGREPEGYTPLCDAVGGYGKRRRGPLRRQMRPVSWAHMATSTRFRAPSFRMRLARWALTVLGVM
jgi:energy-coupling factor transporter ATP-binding protein EcfA2